MSILGNPILMGGNGGGGGANIQSLSVTQNGTYTASGGVDGYSPVVVSVAGGGSKNILSGVEEPTVDQGNNGDIYLKYIEGRTADIPAGATELSYIGLTGSQYINTGIPGNTTDLRTELCYQPTAGYTSEAPVFGADWSASGYFLLLYNGIWRFHTHGVVTDDGTASTSAFTTLYTSRSELRVNQTAYAISGSGTDSSSNIILGRLSYQGTRYGRGNVQYMKMWSGETLIRDFIPVLDPNGVACLYDAVSGNYFYNQGTGNFTSAAAGIITTSSLKVSGAWQNLIGSSIDDVDLGGGGSSDPAALFDIMADCYALNSSAGYNILSSMYVSHTVGDRMEINGRYFQRDTAIPALIVNQTASEVNSRGYVVYSPSQDAFSGTYSEYGSIGYSETLTSPSGNTFYRMRMNSPWVTSTKFVMTISNGGNTITKLAANDFLLNYNLTDSAMVSLMGKIMDALFFCQAGSCYWRVRYYSKSGQSLLYTEYVENGGDAEYGEGESWAAAPNGEAISGILEGVSSNLDVYSTRTLAVRLSTRTTTNASLNIEIGTYDPATGTFTTSASSYIVWNDSRVLTYSASIPASPYVLNGFLSLWYYETGSGATATWRTAAYTDTVYGDQTYSAGTQITHWTAETSKSGLLFYQA